MNKLNIRPEDILHSPETVQRERQGVYLLIDPGAPNWASVNLLGSVMIRRCDGRHTLQELAAALSAELGLNTAEVTGFFDVAAEAGFISTVPDVAPAYRGRASAIAPASLEELWINTNNSCPLRCRHCLVSGGTDPTEPLTTDEMKTTIDQALRLGASRVYFTGGEPFLRKDLLSLAEHVTEQAQLVILSSGVLISQETAVGLKTASRGRLLMQVSLEGPDAPTNDLIRGKGSFDRAVRGIRRLVGAGITPVVTTTLTALNRETAAETTRFLASLGVRDHHILWLHARGRMRQGADDLWVDGESVARIMNELRDAAGAANIVVDNWSSMDARVRGKRGRKNDLCNSGYGMLSVGADGRVYPCAALTGEEAFDCGSIRERTLKEIWLDSSVVNWIRDNSVQKREGCSSCFLKFFCGGGCFSQSYFNHEMTRGYGCIMAADPYCDAYKSQLMELMWEAALPAADEKDDTRPRLYRHMGSELPACSVSENKILDAAFDVGTYHCSCVLAGDDVAGKP